MSAASDCTAPGCLDGIVLSGGDNSVLTFVAPVSNNTGYLAFSMLYFPTADMSDPSTLTNWTGNDWLYYTAIECNTGLIVGLTCLPCPTGGYCPGGGRVWPIPGYWSFDETSAPVACALPQACPGALSDPQFSADGARLTATCAAGYSGTFCSSCATGYYIDLQRCLSCGLESTEKLELSILLVLAAAIFLSMALCVAFLSATHLSMAVAAILLIQHFSLVGKLAGQEVPQELSWLTEFFSILGMLNFDVEFVKPGCVVAMMPFLTVYWATLGLSVAASALFLAAAAARALLGRRAEEKERLRLQEQRQPTLSVIERAAALKETTAQQSERQSSSWRWRFRARVIHSHLILGSILYLRLTTLTFEAINCTVVTQADGQRQEVLAVDLTTACYSGAHLLSAALIAWPMLFLYCIGFPLLCFWLLYRNFHTAARAMTQRTCPSSRFPPSVEMTSQLRAAGTKPLLLNSSSSGLSSPQLLTPTSPKVAVSHVRLQSMRSFSREDTNREVQWFSQQAGATSAGHLRDDSSSETRTLRLPPDRLRGAEGETSVTSPSAPPSYHNGDKLLSPPLSPFSNGRSADVSAGAVSPVSMHLRLTKGLLGSPTSPELRQALRELSQDLRRQETIGYMYRQLRSELYYFRLLAFVTSFGFAAVSVFPSNPTLRVFLTGLFFLLDLLSVGSLHPFELWWRNVLSAALPVLGAVQTLVLLALVQLGLGSIDGSGGIDLGHSTAAQGEAQDPNSSLTGSSERAAEYELYLGLLLLADCLCVAAINRRQIRHWLSSSRLALWLHEVAMRRAVIHVLQVTRGRADSAVPHMPRLQPPLAAQDDTAQPPELLSPHIPLSVREDCEEEEGQTAAMR